jgi:putative acyl-CoA dehydrogenase
MATAERSQARATHEVANQATPLEGHNTFEADAVLTEAVPREGADWAVRELSELGATCGRPETIHLGVEANESPPRLRTHDRYGNRIDEVEFHPAWHELMRIAVSHGIHASPWRHPQPGAHVARGAAAMLMGQVEAGVMCPISMTYSVIPALRVQPDLAAGWEPRFLSLGYEGERLAPAAEKHGALCGMGMTEKQGGSDVRANTTTAAPIDGGGPGAAYEITGHKWFFSAPMCDAFLILAQAERGISCFLMPRFTPDGELNGIHLQRLKDKLGNRSNASSEVEFRGAWAGLVGEEGRGIRTIIEMVNHTRLDCALGSAAGMRHGTAAAIHHCMRRTAFGKLLADQPLMQNVLADLAVESEAATIASLRLARAYDESLAGDEHATELKRVANAVLKYWICKRGPAHAAEALECLGGNGYVEESGMPRLYREAPVNSIWEGAGNIVCLDVLRAIAREPDSLEALLAELQGARGADLRLDGKLVRLSNALADQRDLEPRARQLVEQLALALQASILVRHAPAAIADAFCVSRLSDYPGRQFGVLPSGLDLAAICARARPVLD